MQVPLLVAASLAASALSGCIHWGHLGEEGLRAFERDADPVVNRSLDGLSWRSHATAPTPRAEGAVVAFKGLIHTVGGVTQHGVSPFIPSTAYEIYDPVNDSWSRGPDYPLAVHHQGIAELDGSLFVFGGYTNPDESGPIAAAFRLDPGAREWVPVAPLPEPRGGFDAVALHGGIYVIGGTVPGPYGGDRLDDLVNVPDVHVYDPETDSWSDVAPLPTPRDHLGVVVRDGLIYAGPGRFIHPESATGAMEVYDPHSDAWSSLSPMPTHRSGYADGVYRDHFLSASGEGPWGHWGEVDAYDFETDSWFSLPPVPTPRYGVGGAAVGDRFYVVLGGVQSGNYLVSGLVESLGPA